LTPKQRRQRQQHVKLPHVTQKHEAIEIGTRGTEATTVAATETTGNEIVDMTTTTIENLPIETLAIETPEIYETRVSPTIAAKSEISETHETEIREIREMHETHAISVTAIPEICAIREIVENHTHRDDLTIDDSTHGLTHDQRESHHPLRYPRLRSL